MSLVDFPGGIFVPTPLSTSNTSTSGHTTVTIDAENEKVSFILRAPKSGDISKIGFMTGTVVQATNGLSVSVQGVSASTGDPDGSDFGGSSPLTGLTATSDTWFWAALATDATVTIQNDIAFVIEFTTWASGNDVDFDLTANAIGTTITTHPVAQLFTGSWANQADMPIFGVEYSDGSIEQVPGAFPFSTIKQNLVDTANNPHVFGNKFQVPFNCRMSGAYMHGRTDNGDSQIILFDTDGTTKLETISIDKDILGTSIGLRQFNLTTKRILTKDSDYRIVFTPTSGTLIVRSSEYGVTNDGSNKAMDAIGMGDLFHKTSSNTAAPTVEGDWTDDVLGRIEIGIIIDQLDDGAGGGGGLLNHPGMGGGMQG